MEGGGERGREIEKKIEGRKEYLLILFTFSYLKRIYPFTLMVLCCKLALMILVSYYPES